MGIFHGDEISLFLTSVCIYQFKSHKATAIYNPCPGLYHNIDILRA